MRITRIRAQGISPVRLFSVDQLNDVVVIAGPNGVGKSRLITAILQKFQNLSSYQSIELVIEATRDSERTEWGKNSLDTSIPQDIKVLTKTLQRSRNRRQWNSSVIHFESDRSIQQISSYNFTWDITDPWREDVGWNHTFTGLRGRFNDTIHSLFRKVQSHEKEIAAKALELQKSGQSSMSLDFEDPLKAFKDAFSLLVAPKRLVDPDPRRQQLFYDLDGTQFELGSLSSGERKVVNIIFDFILRTPSDCIIFFDEPELHLHPELSYKLLQALRSAGTNNQFIFCTHSPEIITASLDQTVVFLSPPMKDATHNAMNQAIRVTEDDSTNQALKLLGQSIGIVALGKRLVLIEGTTSSLDKQTYGALLKNRFPGLVLVPTGGKDLIRSFSSVVENVLGKAIWGVDFFMLCDRDSAGITDVSRLESETNGKLRFLGKYHLENYFLDPSVIALIFEDLEPVESWLRDPSCIEEKLREIALSSLSYATALIVSAQIRQKAGNVNLMPKASHDKTVDQLVALITSRAKHELTRAQETLEEAAVEKLTREVYDKLSSALQVQSDAWKTIIPGKQILARFAEASGLDLSRFKTAYLRKVSQQNLATFDDIVSIFSDFATAPSKPQVPTSTS